MAVVTWQMEGAAVHRQLPAVLWHLACRETEEWSVFALIWEHAHTQLSQSQALA